MAQLAGLPDKLINRANVILSQLEATSEEQKTDQKSEEMLAMDKQMTFFTQEQPTKKQNSKEQQVIMETIRSWNVLEMTPMDAMNELYKLQKKVQEQKGR